mgnify:CR=1 FL=1
MKIVVIGRNGQLAWELARLSSKDIEVICLSREQIDLTDKHAVKDALEKNQADAVINASAYTAVDLAETEPEFIEFLSASYQLSLTIINDEGNGLYLVKPDNLTTRRSNDNSSGRQLESN